MSHCGYFVTTLILVTSGLLSTGSSVENKICFNVSDQHICYFQTKEDLTVKQWDTAWNICQNNSATLPIIENQEIQKTFEEYLRKIRLNAKENWLGGRQEVTKKEWQWSNKKPFYQPDLILSGDENLRTQGVIKRTSNSESPSNATIEYRSAFPTWLCDYICQYSASQCPADSSTNQNEHHGCFIVFHDPRLNLSEATKKCNKSGGGLAIFDGDEFLTKVTKVYQQMLLYHSEYYVCYYIGLHRIDTKSWLWMRSNNENSTMEGNYNNWSDRNNRSNGDCLLATAYDQRWKASRCDDQKRFICQTIETQATEKTTTQEQSGTNTLGNLVLTVGLSIGIASLAVITILIIIIANLTRKRRTTSVTRSITENEEQYQDINRFTAYEQETNDYTELTEADNYAELTEADNYKELTEADNYAELTEADNYKELTEADNYTELTQTDNYTELTP